MNEEISISITELVLFSNESADIPRVIIPSFTELSSFNYLNLLIFLTYLLIP